MSARVVRYPDTRAFRDACGEFLRAREPEHNLILGLASNVEAGLYDEVWTAAAVDGRDEIVAVAFRTPPYGVVLTPDSPPEAVDAMCDDLLIDQRDLPTVLAGPEAADRFAQRWSDATGAVVEHGMQQRIHAAERATVPDGVPGRLREATADDAELIGDWSMAFQAEALFEKGDPEEIRRRFLQRFTTGESGMVLWEVDGRPVSMAGFSGPTITGIRVNAVFTPPELRGRGYATACVGELTRSLLDRYRFCFLFTDLANPVSNHVYAKIGYRPVCDVSQLRFVQG